jgi:hypothetical protein
MVDARVQIWTQLFAQEVMLSFQPCCVCADGHVKYIVQFNSSAEAVHSIDPHE